MAVFKKVTDKELLISMILFLVIFVFPWMYGVYHIYLYPLFTFIF